MKRIHFVKLLFVAVLAFSCNFMVYGESPYVGTFPKSGSISNNSYTLGNVTWGFSTTTGKGSPSITFGTAYSNSCIKFGSGSKNCYGSVTLSTDYFSTNDLVVKSVKINAIGSATKDVTMAIGTSTTTVSVDGASWTNIELTRLNVTSTTLSIIFTLNSAGFFINSITIEYESSGSTETTYSVTFYAGTNGTCSTTLLTEKSQGSGVTLPNCNPNTDYTFVGWATTSSATSADAGKTGEIYHPKENCTLYAVYSAVQKYTVTWVVGSNPSKTQSYTTQVASGSKATPPAELTLTGSEIGDCVDTFVGWSKSTLKSPTDTPPSDLFTDESPEAITANTTFNAVFARKQ